VALLSLLISAILGATGVWAWRRRPAANAASKTDVDATTARVRAWLSGE
jgi:hypothetical protein